MQPDPERILNLAIQVIPMNGDIYKIVDQAIGVIADSGITYEVGPLETVMQGNLDELLAVAKAAHLACFAAGAEGVMTHIKIGDHIHGTTIEEKLAPYRS